MTAVAQALKQALRELCHVASMRLDVVNIRCPDSETMLGALSAEGLPDQLVGAAFRPVVSGIRVQVMPGSGLFAGDLGFVSRAPAFTGNHPASRMFAFAQRP